MKYLLSIIVIFLYASSFARCVLTEDLRRLKLDIEVLRVPSKPKQIQVLNPYVAKLFGGDKDMGMKLYLDLDTQLYIPPSVNGYITDNDRIDLMWFNKDTYQNDCTQRIGRVDFVRSIMPRIRVICTDDYYSDGSLPESIKGLHLYFTRDNERRKHMMNEFQDMYDSVARKIEEMADAFAKAS